MSEKESAKKPHNLPIHLIPNEDKDHRDVMQVKLHKDIYNPDTLEQVKDQSPHVSNLRHIYQGVKEVEVREVKKKDYRPDHYIEEEEKYKKALADGTYKREEDKDVVGDAAGKKPASKPAGSTGPGDTGPGNTVLNGPSTGERGGAGVPGAAASGTGDGTRGEEEPTGPKPVGVNNGDTEDSPEEATLHGF